jgi:mRNA interferase HigB
VEGQKKERRQRREDAQQPLLAWFEEVEKARWKSPANVRSPYGSADLVGEGRIVFNIGGHKYRLVVWVKYSIQLLLIKWVGTHEEYDRPRSARRRTTRRTG